MGLIRSCLGDPRLHLGVALALLVLWVAGAFGPGDAPCPACPGHAEPAGACLCYHAPAATAPAPR